MNDNKISIITPVYNNERFLRETIACVMSQTYTNWELLLVDDCSTDGSARIIEEYAENDPRVKYFYLAVNSGAAVARNSALEQAEGRFIAFLDADDLWRKDKLEKQTAFMMRNKVGFSCTDYEVIAEDGRLKNKYVSMPAVIDYDLFLRNTIIQTVGVMADVSVIDKRLLVMPLIRRRQDAATWCKLLKSGYPCYGLNEGLSYYRRVSNSLSSDKIKAVSGTWHLYREIERLSLWKSCRCFIGYAFNACKKRVYI